MFEDSVTDTTIAAIADIALDSPSAIDEYLAFYGAVNDYEEAPRPSVDDVVAVRDRVAAALDMPAGQNHYQTATPFQGRYWIDGHWETSISLSGQSIREARTFRLGISPGIISCRSTDLSAAESTIERAKVKKSLNLDMLDIDPETGEVLGDESGGGSKSEIWEWSRQSRAMMTKTLASLDYSTWLARDGALAMVTLTLPGDWKSVAPNGATFKKMIERFRRRFTRAVGSWVTLWKLEFQRRGAPHFHALMRVPALVVSDGGYPARLGYGEMTDTFENWLSRTWADVVGASREIDTIGQWVRTADGFEIVLDGTESSEYSRHWSAGTGVDFSGKDFSDPRRISMYFAGHSAKTQDGKEYQHRVPARWQRPGDGPGRFWGYCGLDKAFAELDLTQGDYDRLRRQLRKLARARSWEIAVKRRRGAAFRHALELHQDAADAAASVDAFKVRAPKLRRSQLGGGGGQNGGWVLLNDAMAVVLGLSSWLTAAPRRHRSADVVAQHWLWESCYVNAS
jgi:hypothetical protein